VGSREGSLPIRGGSCQQQYALAVPGRTFQRRFLSEQRVERCLLCRSFFCKACIDARNTAAPLRCDEVFLLGLGMPKSRHSASTRSTPGADTALQRKRGRPVQDANEGLRRELIEQSARLFREKGYGNTTVRDIASAAGVHAGSWFYYFKTKQDILQAVIEHGLTVALADIEAIDVDRLPPREAMRQLVRAHLYTLLAPNQDFIPVMLYEWRSLDATGQGHIIALKDRYESIWTRVIERLHASGEWVQPTPVDRLLMFGALNWTAQWYQAGAGISIDALADQAVRFILRAPP
jgi:AcrR family transcriptional regulator